MLTGDRFMTPGDLATLTKTDIISNETLRLD
jgi:hypothetical protein